MSEKQQPQRHFSVGSDHRLITRPMVYGFVGSALATMGISFVLVLVIGNTARPGNNVVNVPGDHKRVVKAAPDADLPQPATTRKITRITGWGDFVDPDGDCMLFDLGGGGKIRISVPGSYHNLNPTPGYANVSAPRVLQDASGDFVLQVKVLPFPRPRAGTAVPGRRSYVGAGLIVWQDGSNLIRFLRAANGDTNWLAASAEAFRDGSYHGERSRGVADTATYLRLERKGDVIACSTSADGQNWNSFSIPPIRLDTNLKLGITAVNSTISEFSPEFEGFLLEVVKR